MNHRAVPPVRADQSAQPAPVAAGTWFRHRSRRGRLHMLVVVRNCPLCGGCHTYKGAGLRNASCGRGKVLIRARKARGMR